MDVVATRDERLVLARHPVDVTRAITRCSVALRWETVFRPCSTRVLQA
jgi:hypothetical protein